MLTPIAEVRSKRWIMNKELQRNDLSIFFEQIRKIDSSGNEYWSARDLAKALEYSEYRHFMPVIERAKDACKKIVVSALRIISRTSSK